MTREEAIKLIQVISKEAGVNVAITDEDKKYKFKDNDKYFYISPSGDIQQSMWTNHITDKFRFNFGNIYKTIEEAEKVNLNIRIMGKLRIFAEEVNEGWKPNWKDVNERKWFATFNHYEQEWAVTNRVSCEDINTIYFKNKKLTERAIEEVLKPFEQEGR